MIGIDGTGFAHDVCRQAGVRGRMDGFRPHLVSGPKARRPSKRPIVWRSTIYDPSHGLRFSGWSGRLRRVSKDRPRGLFSHAAIDVRAVDDALGLQDLFVTIKPFLVVGRHHIEPVRHILDRSALFGCRVDPCDLARNGYSVYAALPGRVE